MLLNNFIYIRSLNKNEQSQYRRSFSSLIPKTTINQITHDPFKEEYEEKIKQIIIGGRSRNERKLERENDDLEEEKETLEEEKETLQEEKESLEEEKEKLEEEVQDIEWDNDDLKEENKELEDKNIELNNENTSLKNEKEECFEKLKDMEEEKTEKTEETTEKKEEQLITHQFNNRKINLDNITKEGGGSKDKNIKNVVVSFF